MNTNPQAQVATEEEQAKKNELLEIYKLHAQLASDMADRLTTTNRFYLLLISGLFAFFFPFLRSIDELIPEGIDKKLIVGGAIVIVASFGYVLSRIWRTCIKNYYRMLSDKYTVLFLLELEAKFEFPFFENEWGKTEDIPYVRFSKFEIATPGYFMVIFYIFMLIGIFLLSGGIFGGD